jgi:hypothetical protein
MHPKAFTHLAIIALGLAGIAAWAGDNTFSYTAPGGITYALSETGRLTVRLKNTVIASGDLAFSDGTVLFSGQPENAQTAAGPVRVLGVRNDHTVDVRREQGQLTVTTSYCFSGEDLKIFASVKNAGKTPLAYPCFTGLTFHFGQKPTGLFRAWTPEELKGGQRTLFHPSAANPVGGSYLVGKDFGVGVSPASPELSRSLFNWTPDAPAKKSARGDPARRCLTVAFADAVPEEGARCFQFTLRLSADTAWQHLLEPYQAYLAEVAGKPQLTAPAGPLAYLRIPSAADHVSAANPCGYSEARLRMDDPATMEAWAEERAPALRQAQVAALIFSGVAGYDPRGVDFTPGFALMSPQARQGYLALSQVLAEKAKPMALGIAGVPHQCDYRLTAATNGTLYVSGNEIEALWGQFIKPLQDKGAAAFSFERFGDRGEDLSTLRHLRKKLGQDALIICASWSDVLLPLACANIAIKGGPAKQNAAGTPPYAWTPAVDWHTLEVCRWLAPGAVFTAKFPRLPEGVNYESPFAWGTRNQLVPWVDARDVGALGDKRSAPCAE